MTAAAPVADAAPAALAAMVKTCRREIPRDPVMTSSCCERQSIASSWFRTAQRIAGTMCGTSARLYKIDHLNFSRDGRSRLRTRSFYKSPAGFAVNCKTHTVRSARRLLPGFGRTGRRGRFLFLFAHAHISGDSGVLGPTARTRRRGRLLCLFAHSHISGDSGVLGPTARTLLLLARSCLLLSQS